MTIIKLINFIPRLLKTVLDNLALNRIRMQLLNFKLAKNGITKEV